MEQEHVLNDKGEFNVQDEDIDLSHYRFEDFVFFVIFWVLGFVIFSHLSLF